MLPTIAAVAAARAEGPHPERRAVLDELALSLLRLHILRRECAQLALVVCRSTPSAGDGERRGARGAGAAA